MCVWFVDKKLQYICKIFDVYIDFNKIGAHFFHYSVESSSMFKNLASQLSISYSSAVLGSQVPMLCIRPNVGHSFTWILM